MAGRYVKRKIILYAALIIGCCWLPVRLFAASPADGADNSVPASWWERAGQIRILLENDIPRGYEEAKRLQENLPDNALPTQRIEALNLLSRAEIYLALTDQAGEHIKQAQRLAQQNNDRIGQVGAWLNAALNSVNQADIGLLTESPLQALTLVEGVKSRPDLVAESMLRAAMMYLRFGKLQETVDMSMELMETARHENDPFMLTYAYQGLGISLDQTHRPKESLTHYEEMLKYAKRIPSKLLRADALIGIANQTQVLHGSKQAEPFYHQALSLFREAGGPFFISRGLFALSENLRAQDRYKEALPLMDEATAIMERHGNKIGMWWTIYTRCSLYLAMGDREKARQEAERSDAIAKEVGLSEYMIKSKRRLAEVADASGDHKRAYALAVESEAMSEESKNIQLSQRMLELAQRYRKESAQRQLSELERRSERQEAELHQKEIRQQWLFVVLVLSLAALSITAYLLLRLRQSNRLLAEINANLEQSRNELRKQRGILQSVLDSMGDGVAVADEAGEYLLLNPVAERIIGKLKNISEVQDRSRRYGFFLSDQATHYPVSQLPLSRAIRGESCDNVELFLRNATNPDGSWLSVTARPLDDRTGFAKGGVAVFSDITSSKRAQQQMELTTRVFEQSAEGIIIFNTDKNILSVNLAFCQMTGYKPEELLGSSLDAVQYIERADQYSDNIWNSIWLQVDREGYWQGEIREQRSDGEIFPVFLSVSVVLDERGKIINYIGINRDITQRKEAEAHIHQLAYYDALTELPNRFLLNDRIEQAISQARREMRAIALMFLDLDRFKNINDSLGHRVGDNVLVETARRLDSMKRGEDTVSRLGGDEFILLFPNTDSDGSAHIARKIINLLSEPFHIGSHELLVTPSIGISIYPIDGETPEALIQNADSAMYRAKQDGRSTFRFFTQEMYLRANRMLKLENALRNALPRQELSLHYQPQVDIQSGGIIGCEALLRWKHPEYGMVSPAEFVPIAEDSGQILPIGEWVLQTALKQIKSWEQAGLPLLPVSVNLSVVQFRQINLIEKIRQILKDTGVPPEYLELELTERITMEEPVIAINIMDRLHQCGIKLSIDDFGTGYSSLSYLKRFNLNRLKIDRSFIKDITVDSEDEEIVKTIIGLARSLNLRTIAEGVETHEQMQLLKIEGCHEIQGYYFSEPLPSDEFAELLHAELRKKGGSVKAGRS